MGDCSGGPAKAKPNRDSSKERAPILKGHPPIEPKAIDKNARLNGIYFDSDEFFNGDVSCITNFTNHNKKMDVRFEYVDIKVYFRNKILGAQAIQPFTQRPGEMTFNTVNFMWSLAYSAEFCCATSTASA
ncbi:hypothetical protein LINPERPRIM_LOCUS33368 [Linum perenne]